ncbi:MAG: type II toxin-antitoxin system Phd/YefM family antitoxin [Proteobacteria bacterium]|nr:type II toxin-antitoxin system Phd/YefM family antitoxin [Pseudomonadota bacterium]
MQVWSVDAANARFSEFLDACLSNGPQMVTVRGVETAVLVSVSEWRRLQQGTGPSLKELLLSSQARAETITATRGIVKRRDL